MRLSTRLFIALGLALAVGLASAASPFASPEPDGLERVAEDKGFLERGELATVQEDSPLPDYAFPGVEDERLATGLAGFLGTLAVFAIGYGLAFGLSRLRRRQADPPRAGPPTPA